MRKTIKRLGAVLLAMAMAVSVLCTGALAADDNYTITINRGINDGSMSQFSAYQIFAGKVDSKNATLSDITWGVNISETGKTELLKFGKDDGLSYSSPAELAEALTVSNAKAFAVEAAKYIVANTSTNTPYKNTQGQNTISIPKNMAGYYLIKNDGQAETDTAYTNFVLKVAGNTSFSPKTGIPTVDKKVNGKETDTAQIGEKVTFTLTGTLPDNYDDYTTYKYVFHDTLSSGLTLDKDSIKVYKNSVDGNNAISSGYTIKPNDTTTSLNDGCTFEVEFANLKDATNTKTDTIIVQYTATLNKSAAVEGNDNKVKLEYSNDPNKEGTGTTTEKEVKVYTFQMNVEKIANDASQTKLKDAKFVLGTKDNLDLGTIDDNGVPTNTTDLIPVIAGTPPLYTVDNLDTNDAKQYIMSTDTNGALYIVGLKPGTYYLYETKAPDGYNRLTKPVKIEIVVTKEGTLTASPTIETTIDGNTTGKITTTDGTIKTVQVVNNAGSTLPSTGGMGTKLFYTIGGILMAGAVIILVVRKRHSDAE